MPTLEDAPMSALMESFNRFMDSAPISPIPSDESSEPEVLRASAPEYLEVEAPIQIVRQNTDAVHAEVPLRSPHRISAPTSNNGARRGPSPVSALDIIQRASQRIINRTNNPSGFDPNKFDPTNLSFKETYDKLATCSLNKHSKFVRDTIMRYSLSISGFPDCPEEDLMLAVYFYFEEKFKVKANFELCVRFDNFNQKNLVGVVLDSIQTKEEILKRAAGLKRSKIRILRNGAFHWILDGFCGN